MIISENLHIKILNFLILCVASSLIFRIPATILIIIFITYNVFTFKKLQFNKNLIYNQAALLLPLIIHLIFFWNNDSWVLAVKDLEKYSCLLLFPVFIIGNYKRLKIIALLEYYTISFCAILCFLFIRYVLFFPDLFQKYQDGIHQWEMGYSFAATFKTHAPALNMHIAFATSTAFYFLVENLKNRKSILKIILKIIVFGLLFYFLLYVNTRLALINTLMAIILVIGFNIYFKKVSKGLIYKSLSIVMLTLFSITVFIVKNPYMIEKYSVVTFNNMDKIGRLDEIDNVRAVAANALVTRLTVWKSAVELITKKPILGYGSSDSKPALFEHYRNTNQQFLYFNKFPIHNQLLDFILKFGIFGALLFFVYFYNILDIGYKQKNILIISFFIIFLVSNFADDFLIRFDGIVYSGFWISCFVCLRKQTLEQIKI